MDPDENPEPAAATGTAAGADDERTDAGPGRRDTLRDGRPDGVERLAGLLVATGLGAGLLALVVAVAGRPTPLLPGQLMIVVALGIVPPAALLASTSGPGSRRRLRQSGFWPPTLRFSVPTGAVAASATFVAYALTDDTVGESRAEARTVATITLYLVILWVTAMLVRRPPSRVPVGLLGAMATAFALTVALPPARDAVDFELGSAPVALSALGVAAIASVALELGWEVSGWDKDG